MSTPDLDAIRELLDARTNLGSTHWDGCRGAHIDCAARVLLDEVDRLADELSEARKVIDAARNALAAMADGFAYDALIDALARWDTLQAIRHVTTADTFPERCACGRTGPCRHCDDQEGPGFTSE